MIIEKSLDNILNSKSKIAIVRLFVSKAHNFKATGREIAKLICFSPPAAHNALKDLFSHKVLKLDIIGKQHVYSIDKDSRLVKNVLGPMFKRENGIKDEIKDYLIKQIALCGIKSKILSIILYGSVQKGKADRASDVDIAVISRNKISVSKIEKKFQYEISDSFYKYFKIHLDVYVKTAEEFRLRLKKNLPPVSTLIKSYSVIWGKDPLDI